MENINIQDVNHIPEKPKVEELGELFTALAKAQADIEVARCDKKNSYHKHKYASLSSIRIASLASLTKNGLSVLQPVSFESTGVYLYTILTHSSGQRMEYKVRINLMGTEFEEKKGPNAIQLFGSQVTYLRRYCYASFLCVVCEEEDDDDGETVMIAARKAEANKTATISKERLETLSTELYKHPDILEGIFKKYDINKLSELPAVQFMRCIERIQELKETKRKRSNHENS